VAPSRDDNSLPLEGLQILDFTAFWAGPAATHMLAALGAEVVKVESVQRPDGMRYTTTAPRAEQWWEWCPVFHGANAGKRGITLAMNDPEGLALAKRLIAGADAVIENFTPRVMENFGLDWNAIHASNPRAVMVRMPAFGLDGPWRDRTGFAQTMEQLTGMAWVTGFADGPPLIPRGACDPFAGMHAVLALLSALEERDRTGVGMLVEVTMVEAALNAAAEQVVEHSADGTLLGRHGNRGPVAAPQGLYACAGAERWLALAVVTDDHWDALRELMGHPAWAQTIDRRAEHDRVDEELAAWCADRQLDDLVEELAAVGVPAAPVIVPRDIADNPQMRARRFFEALAHPVTGTHELPGLPFRFVSRGEQPWYRSAAPTLGQHNHEVLREQLGLDDAEIEGLRARHVIGDRPLGAG
jgi:crotonobetainyl-CoA:carnitine CoA-transferase CaiB-like acyl-CoA transferase